jgi:thiol-disulfide isomerase/thioredoxin
MVLYDICCNKKMRVVLLNSDIRISINMKHIVFLLLLPFTAFAQSGPYHIKGHISDWKGTDTITLSRPVNGKMRVDTTLAKDGNFEFSGTVGEPLSASLHALINASHTNEYATLYIEHGTITVTAKDSLNHSVVKGGPVNTDHSRYMANLSDLSDRFMTLTKLIYSSPAGKIRDSVTKANATEYKAATDSIRERTMRFISANPHSYISLRYLSMYAGAAVDYNKIAPAFYALDTTLQHYDLGKQLESKLAAAKIVHAGMLAPAFTSTTVDGDSLSLYTVVKKGKVTLVDFWASWCAPCRAENPNVVKVYTAFHDKGFNILSVSLDEKEAAWKGAIEKDGMPWYHVSSLKGWQEPVVGLYGVNGVPDNFLLDENGKVIARGLRGDDLYKQLAALLK